MLQTTLTQSKNINNENFWEYQYNNLEEEIKLEIFSQFAIYTMHENKLIAALKKSNVVEISKCMNALGKKLEWSSVVDAEYYVQEEIVERNIPKALFGSRKRYLKTI